MVWTLLAGVAAAAALLPLAMTITNLCAYRRLPHAAIGAEPAGISLLIPARNEAGNIEHAVRAALASEHVDLELIVLDDHSTDQTARLIRDLAKTDPRLRLKLAPALPEGFNGKQHAAYHLATLARHPRLVWIDADVRLKPDALWRIAHRLDRGDAALISGFPHQQTVTLMERLVVSCIELVLLGYLPMAIMRRQSRPSLGAGCGQLFAARREAYFDVGGHAAIRASRHDGIALPMAFRRSGYMTDLFDAGDLARCRMYHSAPEVWHGFAKNATEGMGSPRGIWLWTGLLGSAFVLPWILVIVHLSQAVTLGTYGLTLIILALTASLLNSAVVAWRAGQTLTAAVLRPIGVFLLLTIQWCALTNHLLGRPATWRGRAYAASPPHPPQ